LINDQKHFILFSQGIYFILARSFATKLIDRRLALNL
jgi:hypothetical protein